MKFSKNRILFRGILVVTSFLIVVLILWNTYQFFQVVKVEERTKMEIWAKAQQRLNSLDDNIDLDLILEVINKNTTIPLILTDANDVIIDSRNIDESKAESLLKRFKKENKPIEIEYFKGEYRYLYYGDSPLLVKLKYYPLALILIIVLFTTIIVNYYRTSKYAAQNRLWAGMAKETAHQIGTPLSSLMGWVEIMRADEVDPTTVEEVEKDVFRLQTIADRFSKIGSEPALEPCDLIEQTKESYEYLRSRFAGQVTISFEAPSNQIPIKLNPILHSWTIENLVKNAIDAMKGRGSIRIEILEEEKFVKILVHDTGKGIAKSEFKTIFEPGYSTKVRGWGLGLSLTKRIVEEYHGGKIKVLQSEIGKGTTMQISFKKI